MSQPVVINLFFGSAKEIPNIVIEGGRVFINGSQVPVPPQVKRKKHKNHNSFQEDEKRNTEYMEKCTKSLKKHLKFSDRLIEQDKQQKFRKVDNAVVRITEDEIESFVLSYD